MSCCTSFEDAEIGETGNARRVYSSGNFYTGAMKDGKFHGYGVFNNINRNCEYAGKWVDGKFMSGKITTPDYICEGNFLPPSIYVDVY